MFNELDYVELSNIVFRDGYPGYTPNIIEAPNGDGNLDYNKKYAHIAEKYIDGAPWKTISRLSDALVKAYYKSLEVAVELGVPRTFWPSYEYGALRILEYTPGAITHSHTDFDLFTLTCYRNIQDTVKNEQDPDTWPPVDVYRRMQYGELLELIIPDAYKATRHEVTASQLTQYSIVYFAVPDHAAILPSGQTVGDWIEERKGRSRKEA